MEAVVGNRRRLRFTSEMFDPLGYGECHLENISFACLVGNVSISKHFLGYENKQGFH